MGSGHLGTVSSDLQ